MSFYDFYSLFTLYRCELLSISKSTVDGIQPGIQHAYSAVSVFSDSVRS